MWLPETAVDMETLELLADHGIRFTILAPSQAAGFRISEDDEWTDLNPATIDPTRAYSCELSQGRSIALFFYHGPISHAIAFERLLDNGDDFKSRLVSAFSQDRPWSQLVNVATDGESFGHHHRFGEMALARMIVDLRNEPDVLLTNYGEYLEKHPPSAQAKIVENSSWSCAHGVGRWSEDCGCCLTPRPDWNQEWRTPLRKALDLLRDRAARIFEETTGPLLNDPWAARNAYIKVILQHHDNVQAFLAQNAAGGMDTDQSVIVLKLLEAQKDAMLMYTSCGWFFDDIAGIEPLQILRYAARVLQLVAPFDRTLDRDFHALLSQAQSNLPPHLSGAQVFQNRIAPLIADLPRIAANAAVSTLFLDPQRIRTLYSSEIQISDPVKQESSLARVCFGQMTVFDRATTDRAHFVYAALLPTGADLRCYIMEFQGRAEYDRIRSDLFGRIALKSPSEMIRLMDRMFGRNRYSLSDLFVEQAAEAMNLIMSRRFKDTHDPFQAFHQKTEEIPRFTENNALSPPAHFIAAARFALKRSLNAQIEEILCPSMPVNFDILTERLNSWNISPDVASAENLIRARILFLLRQVEEDPLQETLLKEIRSLLNLCKDREIQPELAEAQAILLRTVRSSPAWTHSDLAPTFQELAELLLVTIPPDTRPP